MPLHFIVSILFLLISTHNFAAEKVTLKNNKLQVDGKYRPQLFGAEIQYFRLRGGQGKNIPRARVLEIWNRALTHAVEAGMNTVSFYIPWDFHEYKEGHFDFDGTVDEDGDGLADYPSRDVKTFIKMIHQHGIKSIMARPGPYINAEWGFLGFGAIPLWFHEKYPDSHMQDSNGLKTKLYDYHSPDLLKHTRVWFQNVYTEVLRPHIGGDGTVLFMQLDNETNFMWQSIFNHDYGPRATERYQEFLKANFLSIEKLNETHGRNWSNWSDVKPAVIPGLNIAEDRSWYEFQDHSIYTYLKKLRLMWEEIGVTEPQVIFTLAESYNAMRNGILPNFKYRNAQGKTGMMTMNLYPKTYDLPSSPLMNLPFKADHDVLSMDAANDAYLGTKNEWLLGPEIQGGWWRNTPVSSASRMQTYLSTVGHGLKALYIYYFTEGDNWQAGWARKQILPLYKKLKDAEFATYSEQSLPHEFWKKLQQNVDQETLVGFDVYRIMTDEEASSPLLYFDAPLDHEARPKAHYTLLKKIGNLLKLHQKFLAEAIRVTDPVVIVKNSAAHAPSPVNGIDSMLMNAEWSGGLMGYIMQAGITPRIHHWNLNDNEDLFKARMIFHQDPGLVDQLMVETYDKFMRNGGTLVSTLGHTLAQKLGISFSAAEVSSNKPIQLRHEKGKPFDAAPRPLHHYTLAQDKCLPLLWNNDQVFAFKCKRGKGYFVQVGALFYDVYNSDWYGSIIDNKPRVEFLKNLLDMALVKPQVYLEDSHEAVVFARTVKSAGIWITVKNGSKVPLRSNLKVAQSLISKNLIKNIKATELMSGKKVLALPVDQAWSIPVNVGPQGSEVYFLKNVDD